MLYYGQVRNITVRILTWLTNTGEIHPGNGVGIENISLGSGKFSAHWVKNDIKDQEFRRVIDTVLLTTR